MQTKTKLLRDSRESEEPRERVIPGGDLPMLMKVPEVSHQISMGLTKTWALINSGEIPSITIGRSRRVLVTALEEWLRQKEDNS